MWLFNRKPTKRALDPETGKPIARSGKQVLQGKLTYIGLGLTAAGAIGKMFGLDLPTDEVRTSLDWLLANWDNLANGIGILTAIYGRLRANWRHEEQLEALTPPPPKRIVRVCGVDCHPGDEFCNGYCKGKADSAPRF